MNTTFEWSAEQKAFFNWFAIGQGNLTGEAFAGSAKTSTIIEGLNRANASSALYAIFNKKNQIEAEKKITNKNVIVKTLHSVGFGFIKSHWRTVRANGGTEYFRIKNLYSDAPAQVIFQTAQLVSYLKNMFEMPTKEEAIKTAVLRDIDISQKNISSGWTLEKICDMAIDSMEKSKEYPKDNLISFDDMVWLPHVNNWIKPSYPLVVVDETQDMNALQLKMIIGCCLPTGRICIIGDTFQCIYVFRGAMLDGLKDFSEKLNSKCLTLSTSYRCPVVICNYASEIIGKTIQPAANAIQGEIISQNFEQVLNSIKVKDAILSRTNFPLMKACLSLLRKNISAYIEGSDIGKKLNSLVDGLEAKDMTDFYTKLDSWLAAKQAKTTAYNAGRVIEEAMDTHETLRVLAETCLTVENLKQKITSLFLDADFVRKPSVVCSTVHKAKGLEWDNVHLLMETFSSNRILTPEQTRTEKNIYYVAVTRAKQKLIKVI